MTNSATSITGAVDERMDWCVPLQRASLTERRISGFPGLWKAGGKSIWSNSSATRYGGRKAWLRK